MADVSGIPSEDEEGDGGEGEEDEGEEEAGDDEGGETPNVEDANGDAPVQETEDLEMSEAIQPSSFEEPDEPRPAVEEVEELTIPKVRFQPPALANLGQQHTAMPHGSSRIEGSPLKNVMVLSPTEPSSQAANTSFSASSYLDVQSRALSTDPSSDSATGQSSTAETTLSGILPPLRDHRPSEQAASQGVRAAAPPAEAPQPTPVEESKPTEAPSNAPDQPQEAAELESTVPPATDTSEPAAPAATSVTAAPDEPTQLVPEVSLQPPDSPALLPTVTEDEDDGLNLLGSLERELDRQEGVSSAGSGKSTPNPAAAEAAAETTTEMAAETTTEMATETTTAAAAATAANEDGATTTSAPAAVPATDAEGIPPAVDAAEASSAPEEVPATTTTEPAGSS